MSENGLSFQCVGLWNSFFFGAQCKLINWGRAFLVCWILVLTEFSNINVSGRLVAWLFPLAPPPRLIVKKEGNFISYDSTFIRSIVIWEMFTGTDEYVRNHTCSAAVWRTRNTRYYLSKTHFCRKTRKVILTYVVPPSPPLRIPQIGSTIGVELFDIRF